MDDDRSFRADQFIPGVSGDFGQGRVYIGEPAVFDDVDAGQGILAKQAEARLALFESLLVLLLVRDIEDRAIGTRSSGRRRCK